MPHQSKQRIIFAVVLAVLAPGVARAALTATVQLTPRDASATANQPLAIDVYLRAIVDTTNPTPSHVANLELDFGGPSASTSPLRFVATGDAPKAFLASSAFAALMPLASDSSLVDVHSSSFADLSYQAAIGGGSGIASNGPDVLIGTLFATATTPGGYTISANHPNTLVQSDDANFDNFTVDFIDATFAVTAAPEPTTLAAGVALASTLMRRRRRAV